VTASLQHGPRHANGRDNIRPASLTQTGLLPATSARDIDGVSGIGFRQVWNLLTFAPTVIAGTWVRLVSTVCLYNAHFYNSTNTDLDEVNIAFRCPAGTYRLRFNAPTVANYGKLDTTIDAALLGTTDLNAAANYLNVVEYTGIVLAEGAHTLKFKVNGKTGTGYYVGLSFIALERTA